MDIRLQRCLCLSILLALSASAAAVSLEEVVVTAQKREENLQDVPLSLSALSSDSIDKLGMSSFREWADYIPGVQMSYGLNSRRGGPAAVIRGVASQIRGGIGDNTANATTAFTLGEVPIFSVSPSLVDMQRIEVLKGPQGTLYGIAAMGGVVRYIPNYADTETLSGKLGAGTGMINQGGNVSDAHAMINIPLVEGVLGARIVGTYESNGGFIDHYFPTLSNADPLSFPDQAFDPRQQGTTTGSDSNGHFLKDANRTHTVGGRFSLTYTPMEELSLRAFTMWQRGTTDDAWQMDGNDPRDLTINRYVLQPQSSEFSLTSLEASYDLGFGSLSYIGGYYTNDLMETVDATRMALQYIRLNGDNFYPTAVTFPFITETEQWTHELRLQGENKPLFGTSLRFDYVIGAFYQNEIREGFFNIAAPDWNANRGPNTNAIVSPGGLIAGSTGSGDYENQAVFVDVTVHFTPHWSLGMGVRYFDQVKDIDGRGFGAGDGTNQIPYDDLVDPDFYPNGRSRGEPSRVKNDGFTPRTTLTYRIDDDRMMYLGLGEGERIAPTAPRTTIPIITPPECETLMRDLNLYDPFVNGTKSDNLRTYDLGLKSTWMDRRLLVNASVYHTEWSDLQQAVILNSVNRNCSQVIEANVGKAIIEGAELEMVYSPVEAISLNMTLSYVDARIDGSPIGVKDSVGDPLEDGDGLVGVPEWTGSVGAQYSFGLPELIGPDYLAYVRADWRYTGERINGFGDRRTLRARLPFNVAQSYSLTDVRLGAENELWDWQIYVSNVFDERAEFESLANYFQAGLREVAISQPRTVGVSVGRKF